MSDDKKLAEKLVDGPIPLGLLLHIQESAATLEHGTIQIVFKGRGAPIDVVTTERLRFQP